MIIQKTGIVNETSIGFPIEKPRGTAGGRRIPGWNDSKIAPLAGAFLFGATPREKRLST